MSITFPDNDNRESRVRELATQTQDELQDASNDYSAFKAILATANETIAAVYKEASLQPPDITTIDILDAADVPPGDTSTPVQIVKIVIDIAGFAGTLKYLAPGAARFLVSTGVMSAETAGKVLIDFTIPVLGREVEITAGDIAGGVLGGIVGGAAIAGIDLGIDAIEGAVARDKLRTAIHQLVPMRLSTRVVRERAATLLLSIQSVKTTMDALEGAGVVLTPAILQNLITKDVQPAVNAEQAITPVTVAAELAQLDSASGSWTNEDN